MADQQKHEADFASRHRARELAAQMIYSLDMHPGQDLETALDLFLEEEGIGEAELPEAKDYCRFLTRGAWERHAEVDDLLLRVVTGWRPERMVSVDRAILRLMIFEGFLRRELPLRSAIAEAVEMARVFGTDNSARFVNGVLARVMKHLFPDAVRFVEEIPPGESPQKEKGFES